MTKKPPKPKHPGANIFEKMTRTRERKAPVIKMTTSTTVRPKR